MHAHTRPKHYFSAFLPMTISLLKRCLTSTRAKIECVSRLASCGCLRPEGWTIHNKRKNTTSKQWSYNPTFDDHCCGCTRFSILTSSLLFSQIKRHSLLLLNNCTNIIYLYHSEYDWLLLWTQTVQYNRPRGLQTVNGSSTYLV